MNNNQYKRSIISFYEDDNIYVNIDNFEDILDYYDEISKKYELKNKYYNNQLNDINVDYNLLLDIEINLNRNRIKQEKIKEKLINFLEENSYLIDNYDIPEEIIEEMNLNIFNKD